MIRLDAEGLQRTKIARRTGIGIASVYRVLADAKRVAGDQKVAARPDVDFTVALGHRSEQRWWEGATGTRLPHQHDHHLCIVAGNHS